MNIKNSILLIGIFILLIFGCTKEWEDYYDVYPETVNENVWDAIQKNSQTSRFVEIIKENQLDTLFNSDISYTIFVPTNNAIDEYVANATIDTTLLKYHIASHFIQSGNIQGKRKIQTLTSKFALFERIGLDISIDGIPINEESPLYLNGKYYLLDQVAAPRPNLYQFYTQTNPILGQYIDDQDSIVLDRERSKPIGFNEKGETVYDTVSIVINKFEIKYFPVKHEFRNATSTIVFPLAEDYNNALDIMALSMGAGYTNHTDIPVEWQYNILIPHLLKQGVFLNMIEPEEFLWKSETDTTKLLNILGDSIPIFYEVTDKTLCSNGYAYNYKSFEIPDSLYLGSTKLEAEWLTNETGVNKYAWSDSVNVESDISINPQQELVLNASNDTIVRVLFPKGYSGKYSVEFDSPSLFPRKYVMVVRTHMDIGGVYDIYVNDELVKTFDYYDYILYRGLMFSVTGKRYIPDGRFNSFDMYVDNIYEYGKAKIRFEYKKPGAVLSNGLVLDYIDFLPAEN